MALNANAKQVKEDIDDTMNQLMGIVATKHAQLTRELNTMKEKKQKQFEDTAKQIQSSITSLKDVTIKYQQSIRSSGSLKVQDRQKSNVKMMKDAMNASSSLLDLKKLPFTTQPVLRVDFKWQSMNTAMEQFSSFVTQEMESKEEEEVKETKRGDSDCSELSFKSVDEAWKAISKKSGVKFNWFMFNLTKKLKLKFNQAGRGGLAECKAFLQTQSKTLLFGLLRVESTDRGGSKRAKFIFVRFVGSAVPFMQKAKLTPQLGKIEDQFPVKHMSLDLDENTISFEIEPLAKEFLRIGGAHKPDAYVFGPGQKFNVK